MNKFLKQVKEACKRLGIPEKYAEVICKLNNFESEEGIEAAVQVFKDVIMPTYEDTDKEKAEKAAKEAAEKAIKEYEEKYKLKDGKVIEVEEKKEDEEDMKDVPEYIKKLIENQNKQMQQLTDNLSKMQQNIITGQKSASADKVFAEAGLPEKWRNRIDVNSETSIEDQVKALQEEYTELKQSIITENLGEGYKPHSGVKPKDLTEEQWTKLMDADDTQSDNSVVSLDI